MGESGLGEGGTVNPGSRGGNKCRGQGGLTGEVAVQADGDIVKSHGGSGSLSPPCDNLQPEPVHVLRGVCVRNSLNWPHLRTQCPVNGCQTLLMMRVIGLPCLRAAVRGSSQHLPLLLQHNALPSPRDCSTCYYNLEFGARV